MDAITDVHPSVVRASEPIDYLQNNLQQSKTLQLRSEALGLQNNC